MDANTLKNMVDSQVQTIADNKLRPLLAQVATEHARISVAQDNLANLSKQIKDVQDEMAKVHDTLTGAFAIAKTSGQ